MAATPPHSVVPAERAAPYQGRLPPSPVATPTEKKTWPHAADQMEGSRSAVMSQVPMNASCPWAGVGVWVRQWAGAWVRGCVGCVHVHACHA